MWEGGGSPWVVRDGGWQEGGKVLFHNEMLPRGRDGQKHKNLQDAPRRPYGRLGARFPSRGAPRRPYGRLGARFPSRGAPRRPYGRLGVVADFVFFPIPSTRQHFIV